MRHRLLMISMLLAMATSLGASDLWVHIRVIENDHRPTNVEVNLPLRLIERLAPMLNDYRHRDSEIYLGHDELNVLELRQLWDRLQSGEPVEEGDSILQLESASEGRRLVVRERHSENSAVVSLPADVIEALLSGPRDELDFKAAVRTMARHGEGELVSAQDDGTVVRIWLDRDPEPRN